VSSEPYITLSLDEIRSAPSDETGATVWKPIRALFGVAAFGVNGFIGRESGDQVIEEHDEMDPARHEELYAVLRGRAEFQLDGKPIDAPAGTLVFVRDPSIVRKAVAREPDTAVLAIGAGPGQVFEPRSWDNPFAAKA